MRAWPLLAVLSLIGFIVVFTLASDNLIQSFGNPSGWSVTLFLLTIVFAVASLMSAISLGRAPKPEVRKGVRAYSIAVSVALVIATLYLAYWGIIGVRTWA